MFRRIAEQFIFITLFQEENDKNMECVKIIGLVLLDTIIVGGFRNSLVKIGHKAHPASRILDTTVWERVGNDVLVLALIGEATADMCYEGRRAQGGSELDRPDQFLVRRSRAGTRRRMRYYKADDKSSKNGNHDILASIKRPTVQSIKRPTRTFLSRNSDDAL